MSAKFNLSFILAYSQQNPILPLVYDKLNY